MLPDKDGMLSGFTIDMLVDVIRSPQRCLTTRRSRTWSQPGPLAADVVARLPDEDGVMQLHGADLDFGTLSGELPKEAEHARSGDGGVAGQGRNVPQAKQAQPPLPAESDDEDADEQWRRRRRRRAPAPPLADLANGDRTVRELPSQFELEEPPISVAPGEWAFDRGAAAAAAADLAAQFAGDLEQAFWEQAFLRDVDRECRGRGREQAHADQANLDEDAMPDDSPKDIHGNDVCDRVQMKPMMLENMTRKHCGRLGRPDGAHAQGAQRVQQASGQTAGQTAAGRAADQHG